MLDFTLTREESDLMFAIVAHTEKLVRGPIDRTQIIMDLSATHKNGCPLDLLHLFTAPDYDLLHDIAGIARHLNRKTGKLEDCFVPRYAVQQ